MNPSLSPPPRLSALAITPPLLLLPSPSPPPTPPRRVVVWRLWVPHTHTVWLSD